MIEWATQNNRIKHMASSRRMQVTASEQAFSLLRELSKLTGKAPATIVREVLDEAVPALETSVEAFRSLRDRPEQSQAAVARFAAQAHAAIAQATLDLSTDKKPGRKPGTKRRQGADSSG